MSTQSAGGNRQQRGDLPATGFGQREQEHQEREHPFREEVAILDPEPQVAVAGRFISAFQWA
jgi:hypothetical protein